jgi:chromosome segregation ATPase
MGISVKQASKVLNLSENEVMEFVSVGKLKAEQKGKRLTIDESGLEALVSDETPKPETIAPGRPRQISFSEAMAQPIVERISALEKEISSRLDLVSENRQIVRELRQKDQEIADRDIEIEKLKRDLVYQKRLLEKEIEDRMRLLDEKWALMDREVSERVARERDEFEKRLELERNTWSERLSQEQEKFADSLAELQTKGGFWSRLVKMLTWS